MSFNGTLIESDDWAGSRITVIVDGLAVGSFEYSVTVFDNTGNSVTDTVNVTVIPLVQQPPLPVIDWVLLIIIGAVVGAVIIVIFLVYFLKKKKTGEY